MAKLTHFSGSHLLCQLNETKIPKDGIWGKNSSSNCLELVSLGTSMHGTGQVLAPWGGLSPLVLTKLPETHRASEAPVVTQKRQRWDSGPGNFWPLSKCLQPDATMLCCWSGMPGLGSPELSSWVEVEGICSANPPWDNCTVTKNHQGWWESVCCEIQLDLVLQQMSWPWLRP